MARVSVWFGVLTSDYVIAEFGLVVLSVVD